MHSDHRFDFGTVATYIEGRVLVVAVAGVRLRLERFALFKCLFFEQVCIRAILVLDCKMIRAG